MTEFYGTIEGETTGETSEQAIRNQLEDALPEDVDVTGLQLRDD